MVISILTYVVQLMFGEFDFGMFFEIISLVFLIVVRLYMEMYDETKNMGTKTEIGIKDEKK